MGVAVPNNLYHVIQIRSTKKQGHSKHVINTCMITCIVCIYICRWNCALMTRDGDLAAVPRGWFAMHGDMRLELLHTWFEAFLVCAGWGPGESVTVQTALSSMQPGMMDHFARALAHLPARWFLVAGPDAMLALASSGRVTKAADISGLCEQLSRKLNYTFTSDIDLRPCQNARISKVSSLPEERIPVARSPMFAQNVQSSRGMPD